MPTLFYTHPVFLEHDTGDGHPERADRLRAVNTAVEHPSFEFLQRAEPPIPDVRLLERVHPAFYVESTLERIPEDGLRHLDGDTVVSPKSGEAALRSAGAVLAAVEAVGNGEVPNAFCAVRPPGHHAEPRQSMGFCLFNNVAIGAFHAQRAMGLKRVAVVDFDVHHGNGTQRAFWEQEHMFYASTHQSPMFPGTGMENERGMYGNIVNCPLPGGSKPDVIRAAYEDTILPRLREFNPDILLISAGFDAHKADPLAHFRLETEDFHWLTTELVKVADECCEGRIVSVLEGGYDLGALASSTAVHIRALMGS